MKVGYHLSSHRARKYLQEELPVTFKRVSALLGMAEGMSTAGGATPPKFHLL